MSAGTNLCAQAPMQGERDRAMSYLHSTRKQFLDTVTPLSAAQWSFKPGAGAWSVAEVAEHLIVTEASVMKGLERALQAPELTPEQKAELKGKGELVMKAIPDRSRKVQAPESVTPSGKYAALQAEAIALFKQLRDRTISFIEKTPAELHSHAFPHPFLKDLDCYHWMLFLAAHADRHIQQMKEVIAGPGFPTK